MSNKKQSSIEQLYRELSRIVLFDNEMDKLSYREAFERAKAIHEEEVDAKIQKSIEQFKDAKNKSTTLRDVMYLDGVLSILDTIKNENI